MSHMSPEVLQLMQDVVRKLMKQHEFWGELAATSQLFLTAFQRRAENLLHEHRVRLKLEDLTLGLRSLADMVHVELQAFGQVTFVFHFLRSNSFF